MFKATISKLKQEVAIWYEKREVKKDGMTVKFEPLWEWLIEKNQE